MPLPSRQPRGLIWTMAAAEAKEAVEQNGDLARTGMGTGPFMFDHWTPGSEIVLKKNETIRFDYRVPNG